MKPKTPKNPKGSGAPKKRATTTKTFRFPLDKREEIVERIKALIPSYNNAYRLRLWAHGLRFTVETH